MRVTLVDIELTTTAAVSLAAPELAVTKGTADLPIARDAWGDPVVPASAVIGSLRAAAATLPGGVQERLFGSGLSSPVAARGEMGIDEDRTRPSLVRALGTSVQLPEGSTVGARAQTAVDRSRGTGADHSLRRREHLPVGTTVRLHLCLEDAEPEDEASLEQLFSAWRPVLGGGRSTGLGGALVTAARRLRLDLTRHADLARWLGSPGLSAFASGPGWTGLDTEQPPPDGAPAIAELSVDFVLTSDLAVGTGGRRRSDARGSVASVARQDGTPVVPGSSWKGVLRSRVEFVLRSLELPACDSTGRPGTCGRCAPCRLFGWSGSAHSDGPVGARGVLTVYDTLLRSRHGGEPETAVLDHTSVDRFTGGAVRGALFAEEVVLGGAVLTLRIEVPRVVEQWAVPLLWTVLLDLHDGYVGVGHGTHRGLGFLELRPAAQGDPWRAALPPALRLMAELPARAGGQ